jgi:hypothetical protein
MTIHGAERVRPGGDVGIDPGAGLAELRGDCARMAARWEARPEPAPGPAGRAGATALPLGGMRVDAVSVRLVAGMSEYGG